MTNPKNVTTPTQPNPALTPAVVTEELAKAIEKLADIGKQLQSSRLKQDTIILLLQHMTKCRRTDIQEVLLALPHIAREFLKPKA